MTITLKVGKNIYKEHIFLQVAQVSHKILHRLITHQVEALSAPTRAGVSPGKLGKDILGEGSLWYGSCESTAQIITSLP